MKEIFREFFNDQDINFRDIDSSTLIIFDTNTLLNIYRYSDVTRKKLIEAMESVSDNIWIPYQVGLEFNLRRKKTLFALKSQPAKKQEDIGKIFKDFEKKISNEIRSITLKSNDVSKQKNSLILETINKLNDLQNDVSESINDIFKMLNLEEDLAAKFGILFKDKIGESFSQEELDNELFDSEFRYANKIPPGYEDVKKEELTNYNGISFEQKYGDLILWKQVLKKAKELNTKQVVFITDDNKDDWWYKLNGQSIGARAELKNEMLRIANADLFMFNSNSFLNKISNEIQDLISINENLDSEFNDDLNESNKTVTSFYNTKNYTDKLNTIYNKGHILKTIEHLKTDRLNKLSVKNYINDEIRVLIEKQSDSVTIDEYNALENTIMSSVLQRNIVSESIENLTKELSRLEIIYESI